MPASRLSFLLIGAVCTLTVALPAQAARDSGKSRTNTSDSIPPRISVPADLLVEATDPGGAIVNYTVTTSDNVDRRVSVSCTPANSSVFALGTTTVDCVSTDSAGNKATANFNVTVRDTSVPKLSLPGALNASSADPAGIAVAFAATAADTVDPAPTLQCSRASGSVFPIGSTTVQCSAKDASGNLSNGSFTVTVAAADTTPPKLSVPADLLAEATGPSGAKVAFTVTASDNVDSKASATCSPLSGSVFALGNTTVNCVSTDSSGNRAAASFLVTVRDTLVPSLGLPGALSATASDASGATVAFSVSANDAVDPAPTLRCSRESGSVFPVGSTAVQCSAEDASGNLSDGSFVVTVTLDSTPVVAADTAAQSDPVSTGSATLSWSAPTTRADGAPFAISELAGYEIYVLSESTGESTVIPISDPLMTEYTLNGLPADIYHFAIGALDTAGLVSELSTVVSKDLR